MDGERRRPMIETATTLVTPLVPAAFAVLLAVLFGALIGSFLNVVIWRVPQGLSIVRPPSACPGCSAPIAWYDNIPILSYLVLRGRCRHCGARISARYPVIEALTAVLFGLVVWGAYLGAYPVILTPALLYWVAIAVALTVIDLDHHRLPNVIVYPTYVVTAVLLIVASMVTGDYGRLLSAAIGLVALGGFYFALAIARPGGMGLGDVKLAGALGLLLGWLGWSQLIVGGFAAFVLGGVIGIALMIGRRANRKTPLPFGPFMLLGAAVGVCAGPALAQSYLSLTGII